MKQITKKEIDALLNAGEIKNSNRGYVDKKGFVVGFYRTRNKRYIEDRYVDKARKLS